MGMVSRKVLAGAAVLVAVAAVLALALYPSESASMQKVENLLAKHGVSMGSGILADMNRLSPDELNGLRDELASLDTGFLFIPEPKTARDTKELVISFADFVLNYNLLESKNQYIVRNFPLPCSEIGIIGERNRLEGELAASLDRLGKKTAYFNQAYGTSFEDVAEMKAWFEGEYAAHEAAYKTLQEECGGMQ